MLDIAVCINIWIRPELQRKQFCIIKQVKPTVLFLISDGGRTNLENDVILKNRAYVESQIDWDCIVYKLYENYNNGLYCMIEKKHKLVWNKVDSCIFMEDDIIPSVSFFFFCYEMLKKYESDMRVSYVSGMNYDGVTNEVDSDYFFTTGSSMWGVAMWKRTYSNYNLNFRNSSYVMDVLCRNIGNNKKTLKRVREYAKNGISDGHIPGSEFYLGLSYYLQNQLVIVPKYNLVSCEGATDDAEHSSKLSLLPKGIRRVYNMKTYELSKELKHPNYIITNHEYVSRMYRILAINHPIILFYRKLSQIMLNIKAGNYAYIKLKIKKKIRKEYER